MENRKKLSFENLNILEIDNYSIDELKYLTSGIVENIAYKIYDCIEENALVEELRNTDKIIADYPQNYKECCKNLRLFCDEIAIFCAYVNVTNELDLMSIMKKVNNAVDLNFNSLCKETGIFISKLIPLYESAAKIENASNSDESNRKKYITSVNNYLKRMSSCLDSSVEYLENNNINLLIPVELYRVFGDAVKAAKTLLDPEKIVEEETKEEVKAQQQETKLCDKEVQRLTAIYKANEMYDRICLDYLRDIEAQAPHSIRDLVENFKHKLNKIAQTFNLPLSKSSSIGMANEAYSQLNKLIDSVTDMKEQAYTTSVYNEK